MPKRVLLDSEGEARLVSQRSSQANVRLRQSHMHRTDNVVGVSETRGHLPPLATSFHGITTPPESPVNHLANNENAHLQSQPLPAQGYNYAGQARLGPSGVQTKSLADVLALAGPDRTRMPATLTCHPTPNVAPKQPQYPIYFPVPGGSLPIPGTSLGAQNHVQGGSTAQQGHETLKQATYQSGEVPQEIRIGPQFVQQQSGQPEPIKPSQLREPTPPKPIDTKFIRDELCSAIEQKVEQVVGQVVEQVVEQQIADAMGPLRLNIKRLDELADTWANYGMHFQRENTDLRDQNDTMSRQIDLHYRTIEQHTELFNSNIKALNSLFEPHSKNIQATTDNLTITAGIVGHLSQVVMNIPQAVNKVVQEAVQQQTQIAIRDILEAQQQAMLSLQPRTPSHHHGATSSSTPLSSSSNTGIPEPRPLSALSYMDVDDQSLSGGTLRTRGNFRHRLSKLFKQNRRSRMGDLF